jgi:hypothetical protein
MKIALKLLLIFFYFGSFAQDVIVKNDKTEIKAKVLEITDQVIKYKKFELLEGPTYNINKVEVFMIIYKNGTKEYIEQPKVASTPVKQTVPTTTSTMLNTSTVNKATPRKPEVDFYYAPSRLTWNFIEGYDGSLSAMADFFNKRATASDATIFTHLNLGLLINGSFYDDGYASITLNDFGLYTNLYFPINKLSNAKNINTGLFPYVYAGALLRYSTAKSNYGSSQSTSDFTGDFLLGFGLDYKFSKGFGITARYDVDYKFGLGINFNF